MGFRDALSKSYIHGLSEISDASSRLARLAWTVLFLGMVAVGCWYLYKLTILFIEGRVYSEVSLEGYAHIEIPNVDICPLARFNKDKLAYRVGDDPELYHYLGMSYMPTGLYDYGIITNDKGKTGDTYMEALIYNWIRHGYEYETKLKNALTNLNISFETFLSEVSLNYMDVVRAYKVELKTTTYSAIGEKLLDEKSAEYGRCFTIQGGTQTSVGPNAGLALELYLNRSVIEVGDGGLNAHGVAINIFPGTFSINNDYIFLEAGKYYQIKIREHHIKAINRTSYRCDDYANNKTINSSFGCVGQCMAKKVLELCGSNCIGAWTMGWYNMEEHGEARPRICTPTDNIVCILQKFWGKNNTKQGDMLRECNEQCPPRCATIYHDKTISSVRLLEPQYLSVGNMTSAEVLQDWIILRIMHDALEATITTEYYVMPLESYIANFGGILGLWVGASILSFIQLLCNGAKVCGKHLRKTPKVN